MNFTKELIESLIAQAGKAQFVSFNYRDKKAGELSRHTIILGASYQRQVEESLLALRLLAPTLTEALQRKACAELLRSYRKTLRSLAQGEYNPDYTCKDAYVVIAQGIKLCVETGEVHVSGLAHTKVVLEPGIWPKVNSRPLTIVKKELSKDLPVARWRQFAIVPENLQSARLQGTELVLN